MAVSEKGYETGLGSMSAEERMAVSKKGYENGLVRMGIAWEEKYTEFVLYDGMPKKGTKLYTWQQNQLTNGAASLSAKIQKEKAENKGSTIWSERRVNLANCVKQKRRE